MGISTSSRTSFSILVLVSVLIFLGEKVKGQDPNVWLETDDGIGLYDYINKSNTCYVHYATNYSGFQDSKVWVNVHETAAQGYDYQGTWVGAPQHISTTNLQSTNHGSAWVAGASIDLSLKVWDNGGVYHNTDYLNEMMLVDIQKQDITGYITNAPKQLVLQFSIDVGKNAGRKLTRLWVKNDGTFLEGGSGNNDINFDKVRLYYETGTTLHFDGTETSDNLWGDYNGDATNDQLWGNDNLATGGIAIPSDGTNKLLCYVVIENFNSTVTASRSAQFKIVNDGMSLDPFGAFSQPKKVRIDEQKNSAPLTGPINVSNSNPLSNGDYLTLADAFAAINAQNQSGYNITVKINGNTSEPATGAVLNQNAGPWTSMNIYPTASGFSITGNVSGSLVSLIRLNGADNVTINGSVGGVGSSKDLTISNTSTTLGSSTIKLETDATNNTITYCNILGSSVESVAAAGGTIWFASNSTLLGNSSNTISYCNIGPVGTNLPSKAIYFTGSVSFPNFNNTITDNNIYDYFNASNTSSGIFVDLGTTDCILKNNSFYQTASRSAAAYQHTAIWIANAAGNNHFISGNIIGYTGAAGVRYAITGIVGTKFYPIYLWVGSTTATRVESNIITGIDILGSCEDDVNGNPFAGIIVNSGLVNIGGTAGNATGNTIGSMTATGSITFTTNSANNSSVCGILSQAPNDWVTNNNSIGGITVANTGSGTIYFTGIRGNTGTSSWTCSNNTIGGSISNSLFNNSTSSSSWIDGIYNSSYAGTFSNNTIRNLTANGGGGAINFSVIGIAISAASVNQIVSQNTIYNLTNTNSSASTDVYGIMLINSTGTNTVDRNFIYGLSNPSTDNTATIIGIKANGGTSTTYKNNIVSINAGTSGAAVYGINDVAGANKIYYNTVSLTGVNATTTTDAALYSSNSTASEIKDNIFYNSRTGSGTHYAYNSTGAAVRSYNDYFGNTSGTVEATSVTVNPGFLNASGTTANDYKPSASLAGTPILGITSDYNSSARSTFIPTMGALENDKIVTTILSPSSVCVGGTINVTFYSVGSFVAGNVYTAQLSDASGSFTLPTSLSPTLNSNAAGTLTINNVVIPAGTTAGTGYKIRVISSNPSLTNDLGIALTVNALPLATITPGPTAGLCPGGSTVLTASAGNSWLWSTGATTQAITVNATGSYSVTVTNANGCSATSLPTVVSPSTPPTATVGTDTPALCAGGTIILKSGPDGMSSYSWTGPNSYSLIPGVPQTINENFDGMGTVGSATIPSNFRTGTSADWNAGSNTTNYAYGTTGTGVVTSTSTGGIINWANGITSSAADRSLGFLNTGSFSTPRSIIYAFTNNSGGTLSTINLTWNYEKYRSGARAFNWTFFHGSTSSPSISASAGDLSYAADASNGIVYNPPTSTSRTVIITGLSVPNGSTYYLRWTLTGVGGSSNGQGLGIDDLSITYGSGNTQNPTIPNATTAMSGAYEVTVIDANGCSDKKSINVTVNPAPIISNMTSTICSVATFTVTPVDPTNGTVPTGTTYSWSAPSVTGGITGGTSGSGAASITGTLVNPSATNATATYTVTPVSGGCTGATFTVTVTVRSYPNLNAGSNSPLCSGNTLTLFANSNATAASYYWTGPVSPGNWSGSNPSVANLTANGTYLVTVTDNNGCTASTSVNVIVNPLPLATASSNSPVCSGGTINLSGGPLGIATYVWSGPNGYATTITTGTPITQNFDGLAASGTGNTWTDGSTINGWYSQRSGTGTTYEASSGGNNTGNMYSFGSASSPGDRALGSVGSGNLAAGNFAYGYKFNNTYGVPITDIKVTYTLEQWRDGGNTPAVPQSVTVWYQTSVTTALAPGTYTGWKMAPGLTLSSPVYTTTAAALDGNANKVTATSIPLPGLSLAAGQSIIIKWDDPDHSGNDHGFGIDDVTISFTYGSDQTPAIINATPAMAGTYTLTVVDANGCSNTATTTVAIGDSWKGTVDNDWNNVNNWACGVPTLNVDAIIPDKRSVTNPTGPPNMPHICCADGAECRNLLISNSASLDIDPGKYLTVYGNVSNSGTFSINSNTLTDNGSLIVYGSSTGNATYNRYLTPVHPSDPTLRRWFIISSPVNTSSVGFDGSNIVHNGSTDYDLAPYIEPDNVGWDGQYYTNLPTSLNKGQGYVARVTGTGILKFTGPLNDINVPVSVTNTPSVYPGPVVVYDNGWNAVGNPFTSAIGITTNVGSTQNFLSVNSSILEDNYNAIYLWYQTDAAETGTGSYSGSEQYYRVINNSGYLGKPYGGSINNENYVQAGQGFLVNVKNNGNIVFTKATSASATGIQFHNTATTMKHTETSWPGITLLAKASGQIRSTIVAFDGNMTTGLDKSYDAGLLSASEFNVYTHLVSADNETDFAIQSLPDDQYDSLVVPIGLDLPEAGVVTFKATGVILPEGVYPVIEDRLLQVSVPLKSESDSLTVPIDEPTWGIGRFYLHFADVSSTVNTNSQKEAREFTARFADQKITLFGVPEQGSRAWLYDINGRKLGGEYRLTSANQNEIPAAGLANGIYLLNIKGKTTSQTLKITVLNK